LFLALAPGETSESFIREVDENLRRSQAEQFARRWGKWLIAAAILFLIAVAAYLFWQNRQTEKAAANSETFSAILGDIGAGKVDDAPKRLDALAAESNDSMGASARLTSAAIALQSGDRSRAINQYRAVSEDTGVPQAYRDAAIIRLTQLELDSLKPEDVIARMQPLAVKDNAWFGSAGEITAMAMIKANRRSEAAQLLSAIAAERSTPPTLRARVEQLASSVALPAAPAPAPAAR